MPIYPPAYNYVIDVSYIWKKPIKWSAQTVKPLKQFLFIIRLYLKKDQSSWERVSQRIDRFGRHRPKIQLTKNHSRKTMNNQGHIISVAVVFPPVVLTTSAFQAQRTVQTKQICEKLNLNVSYDENIGFYHLKRYWNHIIDRNDKLFIR